MKRIATLLLLVALFSTVSPAQKLTRFMLGMTVSGKTSLFESKLKNEYGFEEVHPHFLAGKFYASFAMLVYDSFDSWLNGKDIIVATVSRGNILVAVDMIIYSDPQDTIANRDLYIETCHKMKDDIFYEPVGMTDDLLGKYPAVFTFVQKDIEGKYDSDEFMLRRIVEVIPQDYGVVVSYINGWNLMNGK